MNFLRSKFTNLPTAGRQEELKFIESYIEYK